MAENSKIEWTDHTFNPWIGCQKVSPGCDHCYAEAMMDKRLGKAEWGPHGARVVTSPANWKLPLQWNAKAAASGIRKRVFCASLADVFDNHATVLPEWRAALWQLIAATPHLDWLLLTKRPQNIAKMLPEGWGSGWPNVWLGTTVENQTETDRRIPHLLAIPAAVRFLSCEPLLGPVDLSEWLICPNAREGLSMDPTTGAYECCSNCDWSGILGDINWVICGGESGPHARPMHPDWARSLRDQCQDAGVAFFFKQWGEWAPADLCSEQQESEEIAGRWDGSSLRVGKARAGRLLDGREWNESPQ